jgi:hypothetical protein
MKARTDKIKRDEKNGMKKKLKNFFLISSISVGCSNLCLCWFVWFVVIFLVSDTIHRLAAAPRSADGAFWRSEMKRKELSGENLGEYYKQIIRYVKAALSAILVYAEVFERFGNPDTDEAKKAFINAMAALDNCEKAISEANETLIVSREWGEMASGTPVQASTS